MSNTFISDANNSAANSHDHKESQSLSNEKILLYSIGCNHEEYCDNLKEKLNVTESISTKNNNSSIIHDSRLNRDQNKVCCLHKTYNLILNKTFFLFFYFKFKLKKKEKE